LDRIAGGNYTQVLLKGDFLSNRHSPKTYWSRVKECLTAAFELVLISILVRYFVSISSFSKRTKNDAKDQIFWFLAKPLHATGRVDGDIKQLIANS
jgi:hypothetical protein